MSLSIVPLDGPLGATISGFGPGLSMSGADRDDLLRAWREHLVLIIQDIPLSDPELIAFSRLFGELDPPGPNPYGTIFLPDFPELNVISNVQDKGASDW